MSSLVLSKGCVSTQHVYFGVALFDAQKSDLEPSLIQNISARSKPKAFAFFADLASRSLRETNKVGLKTKMAASPEAAISNCIDLNYFASARPATWLTSVT